MAHATSVEALAPGDHACLTFSDADERLDIVATFVRDGLRRSTKVTCVTETIPADQLSAELVERGVPAPDSLPVNQLCILGVADSWLANGELTAGNMIELLKRQLDDADREGYAGLYVTADMGWVARPTAAADQLPIFEADVGSLFSDGRLTAICQYDREIFDAVTQAFAAGAHSRSVAAAVYYEDPVLRICRQYSPPGIRLAGEIDYSHVAELTVALSEALLLDHDIQVNLAKLRFIDAAAAAAIMHAALSLPAGQVMSIVCGGLARQMLHLVGATAVASVRVVGFHGES